MNKIKHFGFDAKNYRILLIGLGINLLGYILMIGGGSDDPNVFNEDALFSPIRITLAPFFILLGYGVIFFAIMKKPKAASEIQETRAEEPKKEIVKDQKRKK